jgi:hypothetical protein
MPNTGVQQKLRTLYLLKAMQPFELTIKVTSLEQLQALWMIANSDVTTEDFLNTNWQKERYGFEGPFKNPIGIYWSELQNHLIEHHSNENL